MTDLKHAIVRPHIRNWLLARLHALDEVRGVVCADLATIDILNGSLGQRIVAQVLDGFANNLSSIDKEPALAAFKQDAVIAFTCDDHLDIVWHCRPNAKTRGSVVLITDNRMSVFVLDRQ